MDCLHIFQPKYLITTYWIQKQSWDSILCYARYFSPNYFYLGNLVIFHKKIMTTYNGCITVTLKYINKYFTNILVLILNMVNETKIKHEHKKNKLKLNINKNRNKSSLGSLISFKKVKRFWDQNIWWHSCSPWVRAGAFMLRSSVILYNLLAFSQYNYYHFSFFTYWYI